MVVFEKDMWSILWQLNMNDIKYEIWLPSTFDYFKSLSRFSFSFLFYINSRGSFPSSDGANNILKVIRVLMLWKYNRPVTSGLSIMSTSVINTQINSHRSWYVISLWVYNILEISERHFCKEKLTCKWPSKHGCWSYVMVSNAFFYWEAVEKKS